MAKEVVLERGIAIRVACGVFSISESFYRYESKQYAQNDKIANWLIRIPGGSEFNRRGQFRRHLPRNYRYEDIGQAKNSKIDYEPPI